MNSKLYTYRFLTLLSLLCGLLWRIEVEYHGWTGLIWLGYFHWAIPVGFGLFLIWAKGFLELDANKRVLFNVATIVFGVLVYCGLEISLSYFFSQGPSGYVMVISTPPWKYHVYQNAFYFIIPLMPVGTFLILKLFGKNVGAKRLLLSIVCIIFSIPFSTFLLELVNHKGGADYIHAIKSGFLIPLWCFSMGLLFVGKSTPKKNRYPNFDIV